MQEVGVLAAAYPVRGVHQTADTHVIAAAEAMFKHPLQSVPDTLDRLLEGVGDHRCGHAPIDGQYLLALRQFWCTSVGPCLSKRGDLAGHRDRAGSLAVQP